MLLLAFAYALGWFGMKEEGCFRPQLSQNFLDCLTSYMSNHLNASLCIGELSDPQIAMTVVLKFSFLTVADLTASP